MSPSLTLTIVTDEIMQKIKTNLHCMLKTGELKWLGMQAKTGSAVFIFSRLTMIIYNMYLLWEFQQCFPWMWSSKLSWSQISPLLVFFVHNPEQTIDKAGVFVCVCACVFTLYTHTDICAHLVDIYFTPTPVLN